MGKCKWPFLAICAVSVVVVAASAYTSEISLNGDNWTIKDSLGKLNQSVKATVPGQVHLDLM